jgi:hypothetical protein
VAPVSLAFPGKCGSNHCHTRSVTTKRCSNRKSGPMGILIVHRP